jgi:anti-sigma factor (TIGR02949 family)
VKCRTIKCKEVIRELSEYLDGELDSALAEALMRHLEDCEDCGIVVDTTRRTIEMYCNMEPAPLPAEVKQRLQRALEQKLKG